jgi:iron complex outermembrane receptor protein
MFGRRPRHSFILMVGGSLSILASAADAAAQSNDYSISAGPLDIALRQFARQTDREILFDERLLASRRTMGFSGAGAASDVLERVLQNSGLTYRSSSNGALIVVVRPASSAAVPAAAGPDAETPDTQSLAEARMVEPVIVTGSLVVRGGNQVPTSVTVVEISELMRSAPSNIPDGLNQLPQFLGSRSQSQNPQNGTAVTPVAGNYLNLRNLGIIRSLVLLDGQRVPPTSHEGIVDANILPQALIRRVDVVTAGASATYGSDALTGVVNFVLDKRFTGLKGSLQGGISELGDNPAYRVTIAGGTPVFGGRGHALFSLEHYQSDGVKLKSSRPFYNLQPISYGNGGAISYRTELGARQTNASAGGVILSGPLAQQKFNPDGTLSPFDSGRLAPLNGVQIGGDGGLALNSSLVGSLRTEQAFGRLSYDFSEHLTGFIQVAFGESRNRHAHNGADNRFGNLTIFSGNAFLRPEIQAALTAASATEFAMGRQGLEQGRKVVDILNNNISVFGGLQGQLTDDWNWRLSYAGGESTMRAKHTRNPANARYFAAIDAVRHTNGMVVCRVTLTHPGLYPGCVPLNILGADRASREALEYVFGQDSQYHVRNRLHDLALTVSGPVLHLPAGPFSIAAGIEFRSQSLNLESNADPSTPFDRTGLRGVPLGAGRFGNTNQGVSRGSLDVREGFAEADVPLLGNLPLVESLAFNVALRVTDYSTSGRVETWKAGFSYLPVPGVRFRATLSRDIRAPTLNELFAGQQFSSSAHSDVHTGLTTTTSTVRSGNPRLVPEIGQSQTIGFVYQPQWLEGFTGSIDYYNIEIRDAISSRSAEQTSQDCEDSNGTAPSCAFIIRPLPFSDRSPANAVQRILLVPQNQAVAYTHGIDIDIAYRLPFRTAWQTDAVLSLRLLANHAPSYKTRETATAAIEQEAGLGGDQNSFSGDPKWRSSLGVSYEDGPWSLALQQRYIGSMVRSLSPAINYEDNELSAQSYYNMTVSHRFQAASHSIEAFLNVSNLFDKSPPLVPYIREPGLRYPTLQGLYDVVGRHFTFGFRFAF